MPGRTHNRLGLQVLNPLLLRLKTQEVDLISDEIEANPY